ncbi:hypothetical protein RND71_000679 [Anisodus tanguticus]|uniref:Uncharacterized protein n=1 Tax=Anisodus tanguticus TaxID=243964 RepID=A0AAE1VRJ0_9SOLA|nr:hypothetical protein RND71_000679 [Anisodus tanguticus]
MGSDLLPFLTILERVGLGTKAWQAKMLGTVLCVGGAMLWPFYHGSIVPIDQPNIHWKYAQDMTENKSTTNHGNFMSGPFLLIVNAVSWGIWSIIQARVSMVYPAPYSSSALMCLMASFQCLIVGFCFDHNISVWSLRHSIRVVSAIYANTLKCTGLIFLIN